MRKFYFENETGSRIDAQTRTCFLTGLSGLGTGRELSYIKTGDKFVRNYMDTEQAKIQGTLNFMKPNQYKKYEEITNFLICARELFLIYVPDQNTRTEYKREVDIKQIDKGEIEKDGILACKIELTCKSLYYTTNQTRFLVQKTEGEMRYSFRWPARFNDYSIRSVIVDNTGHVEASFDMEIDGYIENPKVEIYQNKVLLHSLTFPAIVLKGEKIFYSSQDDNLFVYHQKASGEKENLINKLSIENENFFKLPLGTSEIKITSDTGVMTRIYLGVYMYYEVR